MNQYGGYGWLQLLTRLLQAMVMLGQLVLSPAILVGTCQLLQNPNNISELRDLTRSGLMLQWILSVEAAHDNAKLMVMKFDWARGCRLNIHVCQVE